MATAQELTDGIARIQTLSAQIVTNISSIGTAASSLDAKLDEIKVFIESLRAGSVLNQAQLDEAVGKINALGNDAEILKSVTEALKAKGDAVLAEADALDE